MLELKDRNSLRISSNKKQRWSPWGRADDGLFLPSAAPSDFSVLPEARHNWTESFFLFCFYRKDCKIECKGALLQMSVHCIFTQAALL